MLNAVIVRHMNIEGPGLLEEMLIEGGVDYDIFDARELRTMRLPRAQLYISMGGAGSANDTDDCTQKEIYTIRQHVNNEGYFLGVCLGAQMLAKALGGTVKQGRREAGNYAVELTEKGIGEPLLAGLGKKLQVFQWHGEKFTLPERARLLARANGMNQMFAYKNALGMQFHLEPTQEMVEEWIKTSPYYAEGAGKTNQQVKEEYRQNCGLYEYALREIFGRFLDGAGR